MARINSCLFLLSAVVLGACIGVSAQTDRTSASGHAKEVPPTVGVDGASSSHVKNVPAPGFTPLGLPFSIDRPQEGSARSIRILSEDEMSRDDRDLLAGAQSTIQERADVQNFEFNGSGWTYHQLVCPALPNHLFVRFTRDDGTRQMSMFSAAIPRNGNGRVHIIPIVRKGYSLFSPAPIGALTIAAFNRIRAEEGMGASADWLGTGLCYAALTGASPQVGELPPGPNKEISAVIPPTLTITTDHGAIIRFVDIAASPNPIQWSMTFDPKGRLLKAAHGPAYVGHLGTTPVSD
jgi:hypothetical protein